MGTYDYLVPKYRPISPMDEQNPNAAYSNQSLTETPRAHVDPDDKRLTAEKRLTAILERIERRLAAIEQKLA